MSIENGEFDPNDPNCAAPAQDPCEDPTPPPGGEGDGETNTGETVITDPVEPVASRPRFLGTLSGPRNMVANNIISRGFRSGFREITIIPQIFYSSTQGGYFESIVYDYESYLWNIESIINNREITKNDLDNLRIFLKKVWIRDTFYGSDSAKKEYFLSNFTEAKQVTADNYTPGPGYMENMRYSITGRTEGEEEIYDPGPEVFDSTTNSWISQINLGFDGGRDPIPYLTEAEENQGSPLPATEMFQFKPFIDDVFQSPLPFNRRELDYIVNPQFSLVTVNPVVNYFDETETNKKTVMHMKSIYRAHFGALNETPPECLEIDSIQKFSSDSIQEMKRANETLKNNYNQYVEISINTSQGSPVTTLMDEYQMDKYFLNMAAATYDKKTKVLIKDQTMFGSITSDSRGQDIGSANRLSNQIGIEEVKAYPQPLYNPDFMCIEKIKTRPLTYFEEELTHEQYPLKYEYWDSPEFLRFTDTIRSQIFLNKMEGQFLTKQYLRSFEDIMNGEKARSEVFGYKIQKHEVTTETVQEENRITGEMIEKVVETVNPVPVQEFYFADSDKVLTIDFVDTQVVPGKTYVYRIYSLNLVFGSRYNYLNMTQPTFVYDQAYGIVGGHRSVSLPVRVEPYVSIIEAPFFEKKVIIEEKPPLAPQASFVPFKGVDNKMQILLSSNFGEREEHPIKILDSDQEIFEKMKQTQEDRSLFGDPLEYATDSIPKQFQVFRRSSPPESYSDFSESDYIKTIDTNFKTLLYIDEENFEPNKNYYYMFRSIDRIGISNPSGVFQVKMVSYENGIFMDLKEYEMRPLQRPMIENMCFKRVLKIEPAFDQRVLGFPGYDLESYDFALSAPFLHMINVGVFDRTGSNNGERSAPEMIWGKKFKIRLTSKHSGKKIDLNVRFNLDFSEKSKPEKKVDFSDPCEPDPFTSVSNQSSFILDTVSKEEMDRIDSIRQKYEEEQRQREELVEQILESERSGNSSATLGSQDFDQETNQSIADALERRRREREEQERRELEEREAQMTPEERQEAQQRRQSLRSGNPNRSLYSGAMHRRGSY